MERLDQQTLFTIIGMIARRYEEINQKLKTIPHYNQDEIQYWIGMSDNCFELRNLLESYVEDQYNEQNKGA